MSHREKSLHPWITNEPDSYLVPADIERAFNMITDWGNEVPPFGPDNPVYLPKSLYDRAAAQGYDMSIYAISRPIPLGPVPYSMTRRGNPK